MTTEEIAAKIAAIKVGDEITFQAHLLAPVSQTVVTKVYFKTNGQRLFVGKSTSKIMQLVPENCLLFLEL